MQHGTKLATKRINAVGCIFNDDFINITSNMYRFIGQFLDEQVDPAAPLISLYLPVPLANL